MCWYSRERAALPECYESPHRAVVTRVEPPPPIPSASRINSVPISTVRLSHPGIFWRSLPAFWVSLSMAFIVIYSADVSNASPSDDEGTGQCSFILTPPKVGQVSGLSVVLVTLRPGPCTIHASPNSSVVCLSVAGQGSQGECASQNGQSPAEARYPYQPGTTYVVKAQGCVSTFQPPYTLCQNFGPTQTTL
jgi:hypothetical protein